MKAIRLEKPGHYAQVEIEEPKKPAAGEALVRVLRVGICGTDVSGFLGKMPFYSYPRIPGHELGVEVLEIGAGVSNVKSGQCCAVEPYLNCQECRACRAGRGNCCESLKVLGVMTDGGLRPRFVLPARKLHPAGDLAPDALPLVETLGIGYHAVERGGPRKGEDVLVVGAGPIGLAAMQFAKIRGARLTVLDVNPRRLEFARQEMAVDATVVVDGSEKQKLDGAFPVVIDATGHAGSMSQAIPFGGGRRCGLTREMPEGTRAQTRRNGNGRGRGAAKADPDQLRLRGPPRGTRLRQLRDRSRRPLRRAGDPGLDAGPLGRRRGSS